MEFTFEGVCRVTAEHKKGDTKSRHVATDFYLEVSDNLDANKYFDKEDVLTKQGSEALTQTFIQGLIGNIHFAHQRNYKNDVEHLRYIISELERGFTSIAETSTSTY